MWATFWESLMQYTACLPKSAIFKTMDYSPGLLKIDLFRPVTIYIQIGVTKIPYPVLGNSRHLPKSAILKPWAIAQGFGFLGLDT